MNLFEDYTYKKDIKGLYQRMRRRTARLVETKDKVLKKQQ